VKVLRYETKKPRRWTPGLKKLKAISIRSRGLGSSSTVTRMLKTEFGLPTSRRVLIHAGASKSDTNTESLAYIKRKYKVANLPDNLPPAASSASLKSRIASGVTGQNGFTAHSAGACRRAPPALQTLQRPAQILHPRVSL